MPRAPARAHTHLRTGRSSERKHVRRIDYAARQRRLKRKIDKLYGDHDGGDSFVIDNSGEHPLFQDEADGR